MNKISGALSVMATAIIALAGNTAIWRVRGEAIVACPCRVPCPCRSNARPSTDHCENLSYVRIVDGSYGATKLNGVEYVWAADECTGAHPVKPTTLYLGATVSAEQTRAIEKIMSGGQCRLNVASGMRARHVALRAAAGRGVYTVTSPRLLRLVVDVRPGPIAMEPLPALDSWGNTVSYVRNLADWVDDPAAKLKWDYSGRQANYRTFEMASSFVDSGLMLAMYRDDTGRFNETHRSLIRDLHLEVPLSASEFKAMLGQVSATGVVAASERNEAAGAVGGLVFGLDGHPRSGVRVQCKPRGGEPSVIAVTNAAGRYFLARVAPGMSEVCASSWDGTVAARSCLALDVQAGKIAEQDHRLTAQQNGK